MTVLLLWIIRSSVKVFEYETSSNSFCLAVINLSFLFHTVWLLNRSHSLHCPGIKSRLQKGIVDNAAGQQDGRTPFWRVLQRSRWQYFVWFTSSKSQYQWCNLVTTTCWIKQDDVLKIHLKYKSKIFNYNLHLSTLYLQWQAKMVTLIKISVKITSKRHRVKPRSKFQAVSVYYFGFVFTLKGERSAIQKNENPRRF